MVQCAAMFFKSFCSRCAETFAVSGGTWKFGKAASVKMKDGAPEIHRQRFRSRRERRGMRAGHVQEAGFPAVSRRGEVAAGAPARRATLPVEVAPSVLLESAVRKTVKRRSER